MSLIPFNLLLLPLFHSFYAECRTFLKGYNKVTIDNVKIACPTNIYTYKKRLSFHTKDRAYCGRKYIIHRKKGVAILVGKQIHSKDREEMTNVPV